jgi:hypothetical protein
MVRRCAGLNADQGGLQLREERQDFTAPQAPLDRDIPSCINSVNLENVLGDVQTNRRNHFHGRPPVWRLATTTSWHIMPGRRPSTPSGHYVQADSGKAFVKDFVAAWTKVMNLDRFDIA